MTERVRAQDALWEQTQLVEAVNHVGRMLSAGLEGQVSISGRYRLQLSFRDPYFFGRDVVLSSFFFATRVPIFQTSQPRTVCLRVPLMVPAFPERGWAIPSPSGPRAPRLQPPAVRARRTPATSHCSTQPYQFSLRVCTTFLMWMRSPAR